ncbi:nuclear transport factor 2 family protein [Rhodococcus zopfii]|uniref:Nuclear transport factor 2 family protein n=1 Tax=Rhodococcus zopfii TaxID=43772 RepID=A0ABU3WUB1_9NOCA|nr:nuclear transport factor 2 family protein [Rhodococcus zopfii]
MSIDIERPLPVEDRMGMTELYARYSTSFDTGDAPGCVELFTDDGTFTVTGREPVVGKEALAQFFGVATQRSAGTHHIVSNIMVEKVSTDRARGSAHVLALRVDGDTVRLAALGRYRDEFAKVDGRWLIHVRCVDSGVPDSLIGAVVVRPD